MEALTAIGQLQAIDIPYFEFVLLGLVLVNMGTRFADHRSDVKQARDGADEMKRSTLHLATNALLVLGALYYIQAVEWYGGVIITVFVVGLVITDYFEFKAHRVQAREDREIEFPKATVISSILTLLYVGYQALFFVVQPYWDKIV